jgi:hypothetical protein
VSRALTQLMKIGIRMSETAKKHASLDDWKTCLVK